MLTSRYNLNYMFFCQKGLGPNITCVDTSDSQLRGKKIIFLLGNMNLGGAERQALFLAQYLQKRENVQIEVWGIGELGLVTKMCDDCGILWKNIPLNFSVGLIRNFSEVVRFSRQLRKAAPDVLLPYTWFPNILCGLVWRFSESRICIWNQRDSGISLESKRAVHWLAVKLTPFFISNSTHAAAFLVDNFKVDRQRLTVIPNGVLLAPPRDNRDVWRSRLGVGDSDFVGCMLANFSPLKDHATAVKAWRLVIDSLAKYHRNALLILAGRDDGMAGSIRTLIYKLQLDQNVCILDLVEDVSGLLAASDIGVHCAEHEGCPNAVLEEMASGLPVVATDNSGVRMALGDDCECFLAGHQDAEGIAQRILSLALNDEYHSLIGKRNVQRVVDHFTVEKMCTGTSEFIENAMRTRGVCRRGLP